jgi:hypothetical protein
MGPPAVNMEDWPGDALVWSFYESRERSPASRAAVRIPGRSKSERLLIAS